MRQPIRLVEVEFASVRATYHTEWTFAKVIDGQGTAAIVEITCGPLTREVVTRLRELVATLKVADISSDEHVVELSALTVPQLRRDRALATAVSALRTAVVDIDAQRNNLTITEALGGEPQQGVDLYANINRSLLGRERTPAAFAAAAERAARAGFAIVKCAPFDEAHPPATTAEVLQMARPGLERVAAVLTAVGPDVRVLVDCHSRFEEHTAPLIAEELAKLDVGWFEEPLQPTKDPDGLARVADKVGIPVAGGESGYGAEFFADLVGRCAVITAMPDVKHCGGIAEARRAGMAAIDAGGEVSLHSPSGPVSQLASAHVTAAIPGASPLEHAVNEAPWRADLLEPPERIEGGRLWFPSETGLGATLNPDTLGRHGGSWRGWA